MSSLSDIDELITRCYSPKAQEYIKDAVSSYEAGATRSAIIMAWIAVVYDLIDKAREIALSGDAEAGTFVASVDRITDQLEKADSGALVRALELERKILADCHAKFSFFTISEMDDLIRLQEDRNRCAHPAFHPLGEQFLPPPELARLHIVNVLRFVLTQPPTQGKAALEAAIDSVRSKHFPIDRDEIDAHFVALGLARAKDALIRGVVDRLVVCGIECHMSDVGRFARAANSLIRLRGSIAEDRIVHQLNKFYPKVSDAEQISYAVLILSVRIEWTALDLAIQNRVKSLIQSAKFEDGRWLAQAARGNNSLDECFAIWLAKLEDDDLAATIGRWLLVSLTPRESLKRFARSRSWVEANQRYATLVSPIMPYAKPRDITYAFYQRQNDKGDWLGSFAYGSFYTEILARNLFTHSELESLAKITDCGEALDEDAVNRRRQDIEDEIPF